MQRTGFTGHNEGLILLVILAAAAAIAAPRIWELYRFGQDKTCLKNMARLAAGDPSGLVCPVAEQPYRIMKKDPVEIIACPASPPHLPLDPRLQRDRGRASMVRQLSLRYDADPPAVADAGWRVDRIEITSSDGGLVVRASPRWWFRWLIAPAAALLILGAVIPLLAQARRGSADIGCLVLGLIVAAPLLLAFGYKGAHDVAYHVPPEGRRIEASGAWFGLVLSEPEILDDVVVLTPVERAGDYYRLLAVYRSDGRSQTRTLFTFHRDDLPAAAVIEEALFPGGVTESAGR